ncbi:hypothetical protein C8R43DRAFT_1233444 [Mycena crocata]|nr:hypothetical protein C8R43DRAFT_1233444 [Mycena crocata]
MRSPFTQHLNTNYVPSDLELHLIRTHLDFTPQHHQIQDYIQSHRALILPARRVPHDLVQDLPRLPPDSPKRCDEPHRGTAAIVPDLQRMARYLPIHAISIVLVASASSLVNALVSSSARWKNITLNLPARWLEKLDDIDAPLLEAIEFSGQKVESRTMGLISSLFRDNTMHSLERGDFVQDLPLVFSQITHLSLIHSDHVAWADTPQTTLSILALCPNLDVVRFQLGGHSMEVAALADLLDQLDLPDLRHLRIPQTALARCPTDGQFLAPLVLGSPNLEYLAVNLGSFTRDGLFETMRGFPRLTTLRLTDLNPAWWDRPTENANMSTPTIYWACCRLNRLMCVRSSAMSRSYLKGRTPENTIKC